MKEFLLKYQLIVTIVVGWSLAQIIKTLIILRIEHRFVPERLIGSGGMPSSHSSTVCSLATAAAYLYSINSFEFAISAVLAIIVMHDAMGVRLETGKQAKVLNALLQENPFAWEGEVLENHLKELVGHTPLQVVCGAILGVLVGVVINNLAH
ncbi:MAG: divergent PAP2 family protein [Lachnospiraceae bacterium]|nr:divergent PAP2 family protein [Lachnospiraceae bacterium]